MSGPEFDLSHARQERHFDTSSMPMWRIGELGLGVLRASLRHGLCGWKRLPIIHRAVKIRTGRGSIRLGHLCELHDRVVLSVIGVPGGAPAILSIGEYTSIWYGTVISARYNISIGRHCAISWHCTILDNDMHKINDLDTGSRAPDRNKGVVIGDHVWLGASSMVLKGVTIGENSIVAAGSIVTRNVPSHTLVAGIPAKPIRRIAGWS